MITATGLQKSHPLFGKRPQSADPGAPLPRDEFSPSARPEACSLSLGYKALAFGALGLSALGCWGAAPPQQVTEQPEVRPVHRHQNPISGEQSTRLQELGEARESDNPAARGVRSNYRHQVDRLLKDANQYLDLADKLESEGRRLESLAQDLDPSVTVAGSTLTEIKDGLTTTVTREGDNWTVEIDNGHRRQTLEDTPAARSVTDGMFTRTLHLTDSILHQAGDFESQQVTRSWQDSLTVNGTRITRNLERMVIDADGRAQLTQTEVFEEPQVASLEEGGPQLTYTQKSTRKNLSTQEVTTSSQRVEVRD